MSMLAGPTGQRGNVTPKGYQTGQLAQFDPEQMQLFQQLFSHLGPNSYLSKLASGDESTFNQIEAPALRQFSSLQGNIASRFSGMGSGARRSSGFQNALTGASSDFAQQLQSQRMGLQRQALQDLFGMSNQLLSQRPYETTLTEKPTSFLEKLLVGLAGGAGTALSAYGLGKF